MRPAEREPGQSCGKTEGIAEKLKGNFRDTSARDHLATCVPCRNALADRLPSVPGHTKNISDLARNIRNGIACAG